MIPFFGVRSGIHSGRTAAALGLLPAQRLGVSLPLQLCVGLLWWSLRTKS